MIVDDELIFIDNALADLEFRIADDGVVGTHLRGPDVATFTRLRIEAKSILDNVLGIANNFSMKLHFSPAGFSLAAVQECGGVIQGAVNHLRRGDTAIATQPSLPSKAPFVDLSRLAALRAAKSPQGDVPNSVAGLSRWS